MTSHDATPTLKPCPFCGSTPTMEPWHGGGPGKQIVHCEHYSCLVAPMVTGETPKLAKLKWNTRFPATAPALAEENARLLAVNADLLRACRWAERALAPFSKDPAEQSGINMLRKAIRGAIPEGNALAQKEHEDV